MATFGGGNKCATCNKSVYPNEQVSFEKKNYHTTCFVCSICKTVINSTSKAGSMDGVVSHRLCFEKQMKTTGGKYGGEKVVAGGKKNEELKVGATAPGATASSPKSLASPASSTAQQSIVTGSKTVETKAPPPPPVAGVPATAKPKIQSETKSEKPQPVTPKAKPETAATKPEKPQPVTPTATKPEKPQPVTPKAKTETVAAKAEVKTAVVAPKAAAKAEAIAITPHDLPVPDIRPSAEQMTQLKHVFQELDKEKSGYLTDLVLASKKAGFPVGEEAAKKLLSGWSGRFNFDEFVSAILPVLQLEHRNWAWVSQLPTQQGEEKGPSIPGRWKTVRVFLSSTFVDMHGERDCLINEVFPEINNRVKSHYVRVVPVDLRWGVSSEETSQIQSTCLNEIDHCRTKSDCLPWFVGLRGRRLGWVQTKYEPPTHFESPEKLKWVPEFWRTETPQSITSMEVYHAFVGAAPSSDNIVRSIFVFRDPGFVKECPEDMKWLFDFEYLPKEKEGKLPPETQHQYAYVPQFARYSADYDLLQQQIRDSPHPKAILDYPCNLKEAKITGQLPWGKKFGVGSVGALDEFRDFITNTLTNSIKAEYPFPGELTPQERENAKHAALIEDRAEGFVGRTELLQKMLDYCQGRVAHNGAMVIVGEPGSGKSALMARFCEMYRALLQGTQTILISHLIGASEDSELVEKLLRRICETIQAQATDQMFPPIPNDFETLKTDTWDKFVGGAVRAGFRVVMVLDAVNQLRPANNAYSMTWLPLELPEDCKIVISTLEFENDTYANLKSWHLALAEERVTPLDGAEREALVSALLAKYHKKLTRDNKDTFLGNQMEILLGKQQGTSPLYLVVACDVLRRFGVYEKLTEYLRSLPGTIPLLFEFVLADLESQHGQALVRLVASLLAVSRGGLSEIEILAILSTPEVKGELGETKSNFSQLYGPLRSFFSSGGEGYIRFFHDQLLYVVRNRYQLQPATSASTQMHRFLGLYFKAVLEADLTGKQQATAGHAFGEVAYHLFHAGLLDDLANLLLSLDFCYRRIELSSVFSLLEDFELYLSGAPNGAVKTLRAALQLAVPILSHGPAELSLQLYIRLSQDVRTFPELAKLLDIRSPKWISSVAQHKSGLLPVYDTGVVRPGTVLSRLQGSSTNVEAAIHYDQGRRLVTVQYDGRVTLWDLASGKPLASFKSHKRIQSVFLSPDASLLLTVGSSAAEPEVYMKLWNLRKPMPTCVVLSGPESVGPAQAASVNSTWDQAVTVHEDSSVLYWNLLKPESPPHHARHPGFFDNFTRNQEAEKAIKKREADRKTVREQKRAARGGEAHSSDESQGDEDDGIAVEYDYRVRNCHLFSEFALTWSEGDDGTVCLWNNKLSEPFCIFDGKDGDSGQQNGSAIGVEAENGPCFVTWSLDGLQTWNFNDIKEPKGEHVKLGMVEKLIPTSRPDRVVVHTDDKVFVLQFTLPQKGQANKITATIVSEFASKQKNNQILDIVLMNNEEDVGALTQYGEMLLHKVGGPNESKQHQLTWGANVNVELERKKEKDSKDNYAMPQAVACLWTGTHILMRWSNGMLTLWHPETQQSNYLFVDTNEARGWRLIPAPNSSTISRAVLWGVSGLISYIDLTHPGVQADDGKQTARVIAEVSPPTYVMDASPMKNSIARDSIYATPDGEKVVTFDTLSGDSCVWHMNGLCAVSLLDAGPTENIYAGLVHEGTKYLSSHFSGVCLWDLPALSPYSSETIKPSDKPHRLLKHRTKKDPGELKVSSRLGVNMATKISTAYEIPGGKSKIMKFDEDIYSCMIVGDTKVLLWGESRLKLWDVAAETCVALTGHTRNIEDVFVSEDQRFALSASEDGTARVWDLSTQTSTVLSGVHNCVPKAQFFKEEKEAKGTDGQVKVITWGKQEACLWTVANNAVVSKTLFTPPIDKDDEFTHVTVLPGSILVLWGYDVGCFFYHPKHPTSPDRYHGRFQKLYVLPSDKDGSARVMACATGGSMTLYTVRLRGEKPDANFKKLSGHSSECEVKPIPDSLDFLTYGATDKKVIYWSAKGEKIWEMTFGYTVTSLHVRYDVGLSRLRALFVHMDGGNFALFKLQQEVQADYEHSRRALQEQEDAAAKKAAKAAKEEADTQAELDALLASLNTDLPKTDDLDLDALLASLNAM